MPSNSTRGASEPGCATAGEEPRHGPELLAGHSGCAALTLGFELRRRCRSGMEPRCVLFRAPSTSTDSPGRLGDDTGGGAVSKAHPADGQTLGEAHGYLERNTREAFGGLLGLKLTGGTRNVYSKIATVILVGLATKNAIIIVEFALQLRDAVHGSRSLGAAALPRA